jgi:hypothetical protein
MFATARAARLSFAGPAVSASTACMRCLDQRQQGVVPTPPGPDEGCGLGSWDSDSLEYEPSTFSAQPCQVPLATSSGGAVEEAKEGCWAKLLQTPVPETDPSHDKEVGFNAASGAAASGGHDSGAAQHPSTPMAVSALRRATPADSPSSCGSEQSKQREPSGSDSAAALHVANSDYPGSVAVFAEVTQGSAAITAPFLASGGCYVDNVPEEEGSGSTVASDRERKNGDAEWPGNCPLRPGRFRKVLFLNQQPAVAGAAVATAAMPPLASPKLPTADMMSPMCCTLTARTGRIVLAVGGTGRRPCFSQEPVCRIGLAACQHPPQQPNSTWGDAKAPWDNLMEELPSRPFSQHAGAFNVRQEASDSAAPDSRPACPKEAPATSDCATRGRPLSRWPVFTPTAASAAAGATARGTAFGPRPASQMLLVAAPAPTSAAAQLGHKASSSASLDRWGGIDLWWRGKQGALVALGAAAGREVEAGRAPSIKLPLERRWVDAARKPFERVLGFRVGRSSAARHQMAGAIRHLPACAGWRWRKQTPAAFLLTTGLLA